jgi:CubicO group peptidase (beta-lactamase class C family)
MTGNGSTAYRKRGVTCEASPRSARWRGLIPALTLLFGVLVLSARATEAPQTASVTPLPPTDVALEGFDQFALATLKAWDVPGMAIAVLRDGTPILAKGYGVRDAQTGAPMTKDTLFPIASVTKAFTALSAGLLIDQERLSLDEPVRKYLPDFAMMDSTATTGITLRDMMSHRTGLPGHDKVWFHNTTLTRDGLLARLPFLEMTAPIRTRFQYNNIMFVLSGLAVEHVAQQTWESFVQQQIFVPLVMTRTTFSYTTALADPDHESGTEISVGHRVPVPLFATTPLMAPAGGIYSSAEDLSHWLSLYLADGRYHGKTLIEPATLRALLANQMATGAVLRHPATISMGYAFGWFCNVFRGYPVLEHGGDLPGISNNVVILPRERIGVVVLMNQANSELRFAMTRTLLDRLLGLPPINWTGDALARRSAATSADVAARGNQGRLRVNGTRPSHDLAAMAGAYLDPGYGTVTIDLNGAALRATYNGDRSELAHWHFDVFDARTTDLENVWHDVRLQFQQDSRGRIAAVDIPLEPQVKPVHFLREPAAQLSDPSYLSQLTGTYELSGNRVTVGLSGNRLLYTAPGQETVKLEPALDGEFTNPANLDSAIRFQLPNAGRASAFEVLSSTGILQAKRVE